MALTITVTDPLANRLQSEADLRKIPVEQFALEVLGQAVQGDEWPPANRRRLALIGKQFATGLALEEAAELQELQHRRIGTWRRWMPRCSTMSPRWNRRPRKLSMPEPRDDITLVFQYPRKFMPAATAPWGTSTTNRTNPGCATNSSSAAFTACGASVGIPSARTLSALTIWSRVPLTRLAFAITTTWSTLVADVIR